MDIDELFLQSCAHENSWNRQQEERMLYQSSSIMSACFFCLFLNVTAAWLPDTVPGRTFWY